MLSEGPFKFWLAGAKSGAENLRSRSDLIFPEFSEFADFSQSPHTRPTDLISNPLPAEDSQFQTFPLLTAWFKMTAIKKIYNNNNK